MPAHTVELTDGELTALRESLDRDLSKNDTDVQDTAIELLGTLPEPEGFGR